MEPVNAAIICCSATVHLHQSSEASMSTFSPDELTYLTPPFAVEVARLINAYGRVAVAVGWCGALAGTGVMAAGVWR